ncbi:MAG: CBS domain-containing protein [Thermotogaceae bacterium]|mgnify:FL=1|jgi:CBS domain-containing protein|nr:CBS domain-containing protein [Mesotoga sp.]MDI9376074.1 CBS domain-containing protein [Thermotogota bacterium]NLX33883.1 CBS domain-containing protein [Thermotogaceae bacterium]
MLSRKGSRLTERNVDDLLEKLRGLFSDITAKDIMVTNIISLTKDRTMWQAKELMRICKISGVPIVDNDNHLLGLVSIEDIILALEGNHITDPIEKHMTKDLITFAPDVDLEGLIERFNRYRYGRFPVVDSEGRLLGIISKKDIIGAILDKFRIIYVHDARRKEVLERNVDWFDRSLISGDYVEKKSADFLFHIDYTEVDMAGVGSAKLKSYLKTRTDDDSLVRRVSIACYEAEVNVVIHSGSEGYIYAWYDESVIRVRVEDYGKGIENVEQAMKEGFSTASDHVRELGFGAGMGLPNMHRYSDKMVVVSEARKGVVVEMNFYRNGRK